MVGEVHEDPEECICLLWTGQQTASEEDKETLLTRGEKNDCCKTMGWEWSTKAKPWTSPESHHLHSNTKKNPSINSQEDYMWEQHTANTEQNLQPRKKKPKKHNSNFSNFLLTFWNLERAEFPACDIHETHDRNIPEENKVCPEKLILLIKSKVAVWSFFESNLEKYWVIIWKILPCLEFTSHSPGNSAMASIELLSSQSLSTWVNVSLSQLFGLFNSGA